MVAEMEIPGTRLLQVKMECMEHPKRVEQMAQVVREIMEEAVEDTFQMDLATQMGVEDLISQV